jgi:hypothetical protein
MCAASRCSLFSKRRCHVSQESPSNGRPYHHPCGPNLRKDRGWMAAPEGFPATSARYGTRCHSSSLWRAAASLIFCTFCSATSGRGQSTLQADAARPRNGLPKRPFFNACASRGCSPWRRWTASISGSWRLRRSTAWPEMIWRTRPICGAPQGMQFPPRFQIDKRHSMSKTVTISDNLAALVEARRRAAGFGTIDAAAEELITRGLIAAAAEDDHSLGLSEEEFRALIDEADASGPAEPWDAAAVNAEVLRRYAALKGA